IVVHMSASDVRVEDNRLWNNGRGISIGGVTSGASPSDIVVRRNQVWAGNPLGDGGGMRLDNVDRALVIHNTFHGMPGFCLMVGNGEGVTRDATVTNNIFSDCALSLRQGSRVERVWIDTNLYF